MGRFKQPPGWLRRGQEAVATVNAAQRWSWWCDACDVGGTCAAVYGSDVAGVHADASPACAAQHGRTHVTVAKATS